MREWLPLTSFVRWALLESVNQGRADMYSNRASGMCFRFLVVAHEGP